MLLNNITRLFNTELAGELLSYTEAKPYLDHAIDDINTVLNSKFPAFSEMPDGKAEYDYFPDRYIRMVVIPGAVWYFYTMDEEGIQAAPQYQLNFRQNLFYMLRDYLSFVPEEYQADTEQGTVTFDFELEGNYPGARSLVIRTDEGVM